MIVERWGGDLYHISIVYVANTLTAFILMNIMASKIQLSNITKFKIGIGCTTFVFMWVIICDRMVDGNAIYVTSGSHMGIFVYWRKFSFNGK